MNDPLPIEEVDPEFASLIKQVANKELSAIVRDKQVFETSKNKTIIIKEILDASSKIGRNDLCPCNSGRKFKKCCFGK